MPATDLRESIQTALAAFSQKSLREAALGFFAALGYESDRSLPINSLDDLRENLDPNGSLQESNAHLSLWKSVHLLFQLTKSELSSSDNELGLQLEAPFELKRDGKLIESYIFFAVDIDSRLDGRPHNRQTFADITRALNRLVPQPILVLFHEGPRVSIAIINRRRNLRDGTRDVLTRVSLIRDIDIRAPHRAHIGLLLRFSLSSLSAESGTIRTYADLDTAWQKLLSTQELKNSFYRSLADWFRWAVSEIKLARLPDHTPETPANRSRATQEFTVRLICRTLFAWFLKEMRLIPAELLELYDAADRRRVLTIGDYSPQGNHYYRGILQNIFFQALNRPMDQRRKSGPAALNDREVTDPALKKLAYVGKQNLPADFAYNLFDCIPYLNGGLFDALPEDNLEFTHEEGTAFHVPNHLFYATREDGFTVAAGSGGRAHQLPVEGLNRIFDRYCFTVAENTPLEEDVALDPELLGLVFENLLAEIDPDDEAAAKSARKASGSYYTPRRIVDYMVNEALHLHLRTEFEKNNASHEDMQLLGRLCYEMSDTEDFAPIAERVVSVLEATRVLDPACGSGAFPMGMLHRMVGLLARVDPDNERWKRRLLDRIPAAMRDDARKGMVGKSYNYLRKLGLIQKNLYGLDIQPLATLIAKLRFFLTLVIEQEVHLADSTHNYGLAALPNLETNLLCANSLIDARHDMLSGPVLKNLRAAREEYYQPQTSRERRDAIAATIGRELATLFPNFAQQTKGIIPRDAQQRYEQDAAWLAEWFKHATVAAPFFNVETFFPELVSAPSSTLAGDMSFMTELGELAAPPPQSASPFHIVIGNPPYGGTKIPDAVKDTLNLGSKDPYGAFIARFLGDPARPSPLAKGGVLAYIVSDTFMTIKTHRPLRKQMLQNRVHKMIRVAGDTFKATVNCAVILTQRGPAAAEHTCQMADLTNVSIHDQYERFLHLLYQTEGTGQMSRRQNVSNQTYAIYHYRQSLIATNSNLPFFVASPKLFALMRDVGNETRISEQSLPNVAYNILLNGREIRVFKLGDQYTGAGRTRHWLNRGLFQVMSGIKTGSNAKYLRLLSDDAQKNFDALEPSRFLDDYDAIALSEEQQRDGITGRRCFVRFEMGMPADIDSGLLPCYHQEPSQIAINWSREAYAAMRAEGHSDLANAEYRFRPLESQISFSATGIYAPTFRKACAPIFLNKASRLFLREGQHVDAWLAQLNSKLVRFLAKSFINHGVDVEVDDLKEIPAVLPAAELSDLAATILHKQARTPSYDYASNEQLEIDRLVYAAYGLSDADIREVEDWYVRRYPKLAQAQRRALAAKQGKSEEQLVTRPTFHLYCDESRHLPRDHEPFMLLGLVSCPAERARDYNTALTALWKTHGIPQHFEAKWTKVSPARLDFYRAVFDWFLSQKDVDLRCLILPDKQKIFARVPDAKRDEIYYSLYYELLKNTIAPGNGYRAFLDIKDTRGREKIKELGDILAMNYPSLTAEERPKLQHVHSDEIRLLQLTDLLLGAVGFAHRPRTPQDSPAKLALVAWLEEKLEQKLSASSALGSAKLVIETLDGRLL